MDDQRKLIQIQEAQNQEQARIVEAMESAKQGQFYFTRDGKVLEIWESIIEKQMGFIIYNSNGYL